MATAEPPPGCDRCAHGLDEHRDSYEHREDVNMRECLVRGCDCRRFWDTDQPPPQGCGARLSNARYDHR